jgi:hypothetical protein
LAAAKDMLGRERCFIRTDLVGVIGKATFGLTAQGSSLHTRGLDYGKRIAIAVKKKSYGCECFLMYRRRKYGIILKWRF